MTTTLTKTPEQEARRRNTVVWVVGLAFVGLVFDGYDLVVYGAVLSTFLRDPTQIGTVTPAVPPGTPAAPTVEARDGALRLTLPAAPAGATHWQLSVDGAVKPLIPVSTTTYWITGLTNGTGYSIGLAGVTSSSSVTVVRIPASYASSSLLS